MVLILRVNSLYYFKCRETIFFIAIALMITNTSKSSPSLCGIMDLKQLSCTEAINHFTYVSHHVFVPCVIEGVGNVQYTGSLV